MTHANVTAIRPPFNHVVAFEVSKEQLVVHTLPDDEQCCIANKPQAVRRLLKAEIKRNCTGKLGPVLVVCEATGGYERHVLDAAIELGLAVHRAHGARVRFFARYLGLAAKTDPIDAKMLAQYGRQTEDLRLYTPPPPECEALRALQARRAEIQDMIIAETNRLEHARHKSVLRSLGAHITALKAAFKAIENEIAELVSETDSLKHKVRLMRTVKGVGPVTATTLLAYLPDIGQLTKGQVARLAGLAPVNDDSGKKRGPRHVEAGRSAIRRCLYMAATVAASSNPLLREFAGRLTARGYPFKYVITAVMRKLVVILNAVLRDGEPWKGAKTA
jgi:transposase